MNPFTEAGRVSGIPTLYKGVRFRSRLEATWAVFFDLCRWRWDYEGDPVEGWLPDFTVQAPGAPGGILRVEIKPTFDNPRDSDLYAKTERSKGLPGDPEVLALGLGPSESRGRARLGWIYQWTETDGGTGLCWEEAFLNYDRRRGIMTERDSGYPRTVMTDRITGQTYPYGSPMPPMIYTSASLSWGEAKNAVQWKGRTAC